MSKRTLRWPAAFAMTAIVGLGVIGCWNPFAPPPGGDPPPIIVQYKDRTSPDNVVYNLNTAYKYMNAREYLACLAEDFEFILNEDDLGDPDNPLPESWGKQEERDIHEAMFADTTNVDRITLTLTLQESGWDPGADPNSPLDDRYTYVEGTDLSVWIGEWQYVANADQEFIFQVDPDDTGPGGEMLWEIIGWRDIRPGRRQSSSWGSLKSMYR